MSKIIFRTLRPYVLLIGFIIYSSSLYASHFFGCDLTYKWVSGYTYQLTMTVYGDCSGSAFSSLPTSTPEIQVWDGSTKYTTFYLKLLAPTKGVEVSPVCPRDTDSTTCRGGTVPGITKFVYSGSVTLSGKSATWFFLFDGNMISATAGRSGGITNLTTPGTTELRDSLNNTNGPNTSPLLTVIPTPFFCDNEPANYNPGAVDSTKGDSLTFQLVSGLDPTSGTVSYASGYSATSPLSVSSGTFSFNSSTGQISFTPNALQKSLVVEQVNQYRHDTLVGTIMREMTFIVLNCSNSAPSGKISNNTSGVIVDSTDMSLCASTGSFNFNINPTDPDSSDITVTPSGLPTGSTFGITGNGTVSPKGKFSWSTTGVKPGTYNFFLTYLNDACPISSKQTQAYSVTVLADPLFTVSLVSPATCAKKAVYKITPSGVDTPWQFFIYKGPTAIDSDKKINIATGAIIDSLKPGVYLFRLFNADTCYTDSVVIVDPPPTIIPSVTMVTPTCVGDSNGIVTISASGGLAPLKYSLGTGTYTSSGKFTGLPAGTYTFHVIDSNFCIKDTIVVLPDPPAILATVAFSKPPCNHFQNGSISLKAYNSVAPYQYALGSGAYNDSGIFHNLYSGLYTVHIQNALGCTKDTIVVLPDSIKITATIPVKNELCFGGNNGSITINAKGGYGPPFLYSLNGGGLSGASNYTSLFAGTYKIHIQDTVLCYFDSTVTIKQPSIIRFTNGIKNVDCYLNATGADTVHATGGTPPYQYSKNGGPFVSSNTFSGLTTGTYIITIKDSNNCTQNDTITITQPNKLVITHISIIKPLCHGDANGYIVVTISGGTPPYTYAVNTGGFSLNDTLMNLATGNYTIHVKDSNGCTIDSAVFMPEPTAVAVNAAVKKSVCSTLANGEVTLYPSGGTPGYTFAQGTGTYSTDSAFTPLSAGTYTFHVKDTNQCIKDTTITVADSFILSQKVKINDALCFDSSSGRIIITAAGGTSPYQYNLNPPGTSSTNDTFVRLHAGSYVTTITDSNGCIYDTTVTVGEPTIIVPSVTFVSPSCYGYSDGSIIVGATGGTPAYTYSLNDSPYTTTTTFNNLAARLDTIWVRDSHGCNYDTLVTVTQPRPLNYDSLILSNVKCFGDNSGYVKVVASGGTPAYKYAANTSPFQANDTLTGLYVGRQTIHLTDSHNCHLDSVVTLSQPPLLLIAIDTLIEPTCQYYTDGRLVILGAGGTPPYLYSTDNVTFSKTTVYPDLAEGAYTFYITDTNNCKHDTTVTLIGYPHIVIDNINIQNISCSGLQDGKIILNVTGGVQPLTYSIDGYTPVSTSEFDSVLAGTYRIVITDSKNCKKDTTVEMSEPDKMVLTTTINANECIGPDTLGRASVDVKGGTPPYSYVWSTNPEITGNVLYGMPNGNYKVWVHDVNNCNDSALMTIQYDDCCKPFIPDAFTPNGDGKNDNFRIRFKGDMKLLEFSIYNRFGQRVFYTTYVQQGWDGTFNGVPQELGTYYYYVRAICGNKEDHNVTYKGDVTLIR